MVDDIKEYAESLYTDEEFQLRRANYAYCMPFTKESLFYREIFEKYYHGQAAMIVDFWMPNKAWPNCNVNDPSPACWQTTVLPVPTCRFEGRCLASSRGTCISNSNQQNNRIHTPAVDAQLRGGGAFYTLPLAPNRGIGYNEGTKQKEHFA